jgi:hypothetical protein
MDLSFLTNGDNVKLATSALALGTAALTLWNTLSSRKKNPPPVPPTVNQTLIVVGGGWSAVESPLFKKI